MAIDDPALLVFKAGTVVGYDTRDITTVRIPEFRQIAIILE